MIGTDLRGVVLSRPPFEMIRSAAGQPARRLSVTVSA
jgi:hypothetical protein